MLFVLFVSFDDCVAHEKDHDCKDCWDCDVCKEMHIVFVLICYSYILSDWIRINTVSTTS